MRIKRTFNFLPEANEVLDRLLVTQSAPTESAGLAALLFGLDEGLRHYLDLPAIAAYEACELTRSAKSKALLRYREREAAKNAANGTPLPGLMPAA
jgi:hypothetical protein